MKNNKFNWLGFFLLLTAFSSLVASCNKKFDEPPLYVEPNITANMTIQELKALYTTAGTLREITEDKIIAGIVAGDDKSGNLYKSLAIQDATGGISFRLDGTSLYTSYPVGRKIYVKLKGLCLGEYGGMLQLGIIDNSTATPEQIPVPSALFEKHIVKASLNNAVTPVVVTPADLTTTLQDKYQNTLIELKDFEFATGDTNKTYADPTRVSSARNFVLRSCDGSSITLRSSSYSNFAGVNVPNGNGTVIGLYTFFGSTKQLTIRDTSDVRFNSARCAAFEEDFESTAGTGALNLAGWSNIAEVGGVSYTNNTFSGTKFAQVTAFRATGSPAVVTSWLITPAIDLTGMATPVLTFQTIDGFNNGATLKTFVSTNYTPGNTTPSTSATWVELPAAYAGPTASGYARNWVNSGKVDLKAYTGRRVYIGFRYDGSTTTSKTTTWQVDNVKISKQ